MARSQKTLSIPHKNADGCGCSPKDDVQDPKEWSKELECGKIGPKGVAQDLEVWSKSLGRSPRL